MDLGSGITFDIFTHVFTRVILFEIFINIITNVKEKYSLRVLTMDITLAHLKKEAITLQVVISGFNRLKKHT